MGYFFRIFSVESDINADQSATCGSMACTGAPTHGHFLTFPHLSQCTQYRSGPEVWSYGWSVYDQQRYVAFFPFHTGNSIPDKKFHNSV